MVFARSTLIMVVAVALSACARTSVGEVKVVDREGSVARAELVLCGKRLPLRREGSSLSANFQVTCEGSGSVLLHLNGGGTASCLIGYVTPGANQVFEYTVENRQCR